MIIKLKFAILTDPTQALMHWDFEDNKSFFCEQKNCYGCAASLQQKRRYVFGSYCYIDKEIKVKTYGVPFFRAMADIVKHNQSNDNIVFNIKVDKFGVRGYPSPIPNLKEIEDMKRSFDESRLQEATVNSDEVKKYLNKKTKALILT